MFTDEDKITGVCCSDCAIMTENNDRSGVAEDWNWTGWFLTMSHYHVVIEGHVTDFSTARCDICLSTLAGTRHDVVMWEFPDDVEGELPEIEKIEEGWT